MSRFEKIDRLPPYGLSIVNELKLEARRRGEDVIDLGFGNPNHATPPHIVEKLASAARDPRNHRYSSSRGLPNLRRAITDWYRRRFQVDLDADTEVLTTIGAKEGLSHFVMGTISHGDVVLCPDPCYPIHAFSVVIAGGDIHRVPAPTPGDLRPTPRRHDLVVLAAPQAVDRVLPAQSDHRLGRPGVHDPAG